MLYSESSIRILLGDVVVAVVDFPFDPSHHTVRVDQPYQGCEVGVEDEHGSLIVNDA